MESIKTKRQQKNKRAAKKRKVEIRKGTVTKQPQKKQQIRRREKISRIIATILLIMTVVIVVIVVVIASSHNSKVGSPELSKTTISTETTLQEQPKKSKLRSPDNAINSLDPEAKKAYIASMIPKAKFQIGQAVREFDETGTVAGYVEDRVSYGEPPELLYYIKLNSGEVREVTESLLEKF